MHVNDFIRNILELSKIKITIAVALTTIAGYVLAKHRIEAEALFVTAGIFFMACGASVLNHIQERRTDGIMKRTRERPLPAGRVSLSFAVVLCILETTAGSLVLYFLVNEIAFLLGWIALAWYNFIYTYLKRITPHAVIPGSVIGSIPPLAGWVAAGGSIFDLDALFIALFFFLWQVPHFYMLGIKYGPQYEKAGMPSLTGQHSEKTIRKMVFLWILLTVVSVIFLYSSKIAVSYTGMFLAFGASLWLTIIFLIPLVKKDTEFVPIRYFMRINYYVLFIVVLLICDHLLAEYLI